MGQLDAMTDEQRVITGLSLLVAARDDMMGAFGNYLTAAQSLEKWLYDGAKTDEQSAREIAPDVKKALSALTTLGVVSQRVASGAAHAAGMRPDGTVN